MQGQLLSEGISIIFVLALTLAFVPVVNAKIADHVVISEVLPDPTGVDDGKEYIELYNPTDIEVNIGGWVIDTKRYDSDATIPSNATIQAYSFYLIGDTPWTPEADWPISPNHEEEILLTNDDGWVRLRKSSGGEIVDIVGWGTATTNETMNAAKPGSGQSLQRKVNATINENANYGPAWDSDNNSADFFIQTKPNPQNSTWTEEHGPLPPIPELPSIVLLAFGLLMLAGYVLLTKRRR